MCTKGIRARRRTPLRAATIRALRGIATRATTLGWASKGATTSTEAPKVHHSNAFHAMREKRYGTSTFAQARIVLRCTLTEHAKGVALQRFAVVKRLTASG